MSTPTAPSAAPMQVDGGALHHAGRRLAPLPAPRPRRLHPLPPVRTGAISDRDRQRAETIPEARRVQTTWGYCGVGCQLDVHVGADERVLRIDGTADAKVNAGHLCVKGRYAHAFSRHPERLRTPLVRKEGVLVPVSWEEALETVAREMNRLCGHVAALSSSRCTNEENHLLQKWMRAGMGTNNMDEIAQVNPSFTGVHHHRLDHDGLQWPVPAEDHPGTVRLHAERFPVGKARLAEVPFLPSPSLALVAVDALELHPVDAARAGVVDGAPVRVRSPWGEARATACITDRVSEGTAFLAFHFPETATNALMSPVLDRIADCPEYKVTPVRVDPA